MDRGLRLLLAVFLSVAACSQHAGSGGPGSGGVSAGPTGKAAGAGGGTGDGTGGRAGTGGSSSGGGTSATTGAMGGDQAGGAPGGGGGGGREEGGYVGTGAPATTGSPVTGGRGGGPGSINNIPSDAGVPPDAAGDSGSSGCPSGALLCDDFESYPLGGSLSPNWTTQLVNGQVQVETSRPFRGAKSVRMTTTLSPANEPVRTNGGPLRAATLIKEGAPLFPLPNNSFFGRAMIWLTKMPPGGVHFSNIEALGHLADGTLAKYGEGGMNEKLLAGYTIRPMTELDQPSVDCSKSATTGVPEGRWVCVEWQFDGSKDEMHLWFDGALQTGVDVVKQAGGCPVGWKAPVFEKMYLGWRHSQPSSIDTEMWLDDVVLHTARIGCPN